MGVAQQFPAIPCLCAGGETLSVYLICSVMSNFLLYHAIEYANHLATCILYLYTMYIYTQSNCWAGDLLCGGRGLHVPCEGSTRSGGGAQRGLLERFSFPHQGLSCMTLHIPYFSVYL